MKRIVLAAYNATVSNATDRYGAFEGGATAYTTTNTNETVIAVPGVISNLYMALSAAPGTSTSYTAILVLNTVEQSSFAVTISDAATTGSNTSVSVNVVAGDRVAWVVRPATTPGAATVKISCVFEGANPSETTITGCTAAAVAASTTNYWALYGGTARTTVADGQVQSPNTFTLDNLYVATAASIGAGLTAQFTLYKNGSPTLLSATVTGTATSNSDLFVNTGHSVSFTATDLIAMEIVTVAATTSRIMKWGMRLTPGTVGEFPLFASATNGLISTGNRFEFVQGTTTNISTESLAQGIAPWPFVLKTFYAVVEPAPGATKTWTFRSRIDTGGGPANGTLVVTWGDPSTTGPPDTTHSDSYAAGNLVDWASTPSGNPTTVTKSMLSAVSYIVPTGGNFFPFFAK